MPASANRSASPSSKAAPSSELAVVESPKPARSRAKQPAATATSRPTLSVVGPKAASKPNLTEWAADALEDSRSNTFLCDADFNILYANKKSYDILAFMEPNLRAHSDTWKGFAASDVVGMNLSFLFADEPMEYRRASDPRNLPYQSRIKTGPCVCDIQITGLRDKTGQLNGYSVDWERITDKLAQERRVNQLMTALEQSTANTFLCDLNWNVLYANKKSYDIMAFMEPNLHAHSEAWRSFRAKDVIGKSLDWLFTDEPEQFRKASDPRNHPYQCIIRTGPCVCDVTITSTKDETGNVTGYAVYWERITDKVKMEAQVNAQLEEGKYLAAKIEEIKSNVLAIADGNFTQTIPVDREDAVGTLATSLNEMVSNLSQMVAQVQVSADKIAQGTADVAAGNDDLSQRVEEQASSLEETASSMEEMTSTVKQNADNARQANQLAAQAREVAEKGGGVVSRAVSSMAEINTASKRIADIISVIDEIAFQTNLLALNAAVEAARVGEQGRGFAVVATEVRSLAGRSATAAKEIKALVQDSVQKVQEGSTLVNQSGQQLEEIVGSVKKVADIISEISAASQEQAAGIDQVNKAVMQMDQITQQNAAIVEEAAAASQAMNAQARGLQTVVGQFSIEDRYVTEAQQKAESKSGVSPRKAAPAPAPSRSARMSAPVRSARFAASSVADDDGFEEF